MQQHPDSAGGESTRATLTLLLLLVGADLGFILLHVVYVETRWLSGPSFSLEADGGLPEAYQYVKQFWIMGCMAAACWFTRSKVYAVWALVFAFLMLDDAGQIHERAGLWLGERYAMPPIFGLRPDDLGELTFAVAVGVVIMTLVSLTAWRAGERTRRVTYDVLSLLLLLAFVGVVVDALHVIAYFQRSLLAQILLLVEDGGEMLVMSGLTAYAFHIASHRGRTTLDLRGVFRECLTRWRALFSVSANRGRARA